MSSKLPVSELLRLACIYAERDQQELLTAWSHSPDEPQCDEIRAFLKQLRAYRLKRWGKTQLENFIETATSTPVAQVAEKLGKSPQCEHEWGPQETFTEPDFGVAYASQRVCKKCHWRLFDDWCANRSSGVEHLLPPEAEAVA